MGNGDSKVSSSEANKGSRRARFKEHLHLGRHFHRYHHRRNGNGSSGSSSSAVKHISADNFAGIAILTLIRAEMQFKDKWIACLSLGEQAFRSKTSDQLSSGKASWASYDHFSCIMILYLKCRYSIQPQFHENNMWTFFF